MITPKQFVNGQCVIYDGQIHVVLYTQHKRTAQRGAVVRTKLRNINTGSIIETNLDPDATYDVAYIDKKVMLFMYHKDEMYHFMDQTTYEQFSLSKTILGDSIDLLKENTEVSVNFYEGQPISVDLPVFVELKITYTEPGLKGDTARGGSKPATLETGASIKVPLFIDNGEIVRVDTRTHEYVGRV